MSALTRRTLRRAASTASAVYRDASTSASPEPAPAPTAGTKRKRAAAATPKQAATPAPKTKKSPRVAADDDDEYGLGILRGTAAPAAALSAGESASESDLTPDDSSDAASPPKRKSPKKKARASPRKKAAPAEVATGIGSDVGEEDGAEGDGESLKKTPRKRKPRAPKPEPVYVIPDVERKETTFKGRLGYACLNTVLRGRKAEDAVFCSRTCRIDTIKKNGMDYVKELGRQNIRDLLALVEWNEANNIKFMRMSSEMFPFASHPQYGYSLAYCAADLAAVGARANALGHRLTTHPGQFTQLGSPRGEVVKNAVRDLTYHCEMMDLMGLGKDSVMIIHGGGVYGDKPAALERMRTNIPALLPVNVRARLVLENDEMCYSAEDLLPLCEELDIPLVFDYHHDWLNPSSIGREEVIRRAQAIFARRGITPKQHLSEPRTGAVTLMEKRAHADRCQALPDLLPDDMDLMIEAKDKEQAVLHLYRMYDLHLVIHKNLRPPADVESTQTKGRKSTGRKKAVESGVVAEEDEVKGEDPAVPVDDDAEEAPGELPVVGRRSRTTSPVKRATPKKRESPVKRESAAKKGKSW